MIGTGKIAGIEHWVLQFGEEQFTLWHGQYGQAVVKDFLMRVCAVGQPAVVLANFRFELAPDFIDLPPLMGIEAKLILRSRCP